MLKKLCLHISFSILLLNLDDDWQVSEVEAHHKNEDVIIKIVHIG